MYQVQQRKIEIIDDVYITKLLKSDDVNEEVPTGGRRSQRSTWYRY